MIKMKIIIIERKCKENKICFSFFHIFRLHRILQVKNNEKSVDMF